MDELELHAEFEMITPLELYRAWLDSDEHTYMTGSAAQIEPEVGGVHRAWDGYITGKILELEEGAAIVMSWRTSNFDDDHEDSRLEVSFADNGAGGTVVHIEHTHIPDGQGSEYLRGWEEHYFEPMRLYFGEDSFTDVEDLQEDS